MSSSTTSIRPLPRIPLALDPRNDTPEQAAERVRYEQEVRDFDFKASVAAEHKKSSAWRIKLGVAVAAAVILLAVVLFLVLKLASTQKQLPETVAAAVTAPIKGAMMAIVETDGQKSREMMVNGFKANQDLIRSTGQAVLELKTAVDKQTMDQKIGADQLLVSVKSTLENAAAAKTAAEELRVKMASLTPTNGYSQPTAGQSGLWPELTQHVQRHVLLKAALGQIEAGSTTPPAVQTPPPPAPQPTVTTNRGAIPTVNEPSPRMASKPGQIKLLKQLAPNELSEHYSFAEVNGKRVFPSETAGVIARCYQDLGSGAPVDVEIPASGPYYLAPNTRKVQFFCPSGPMAVYGY